MPATRRAVDLTRCSHKEHRILLSRRGDRPREVWKGRFWQHTAAGAWCLYSHPRHPTERVAKLFAIAPEDLCPEYSPPYYSPPRDVVVEERLYYDRAKRRQVEGLARALGVSMDERIKKELA